MGLNKLLIAACLLASTATAQDVQVTKRHRLVDFLGGVQVEATVTGGDTLYVVSYQDGRYRALNSYEVIPMRPQPFQDWMDAMNKLLDPQYPAGESSLTIGDIRLHKLKAMGIISLSMIYKGGSTALMTQKQILKIEKAHNSFVHPQAK